RRPSAAGSRATPRTTAGAALPILPGTAHGLRLACRRGEMTKRRKGFVHAWKLSLLAVLDGHELEVVRPRVIGRGADDLAVDALLDHVRGPARGAGNDE